MSAIASFIKLPKSAIEGLRKAATDGTDRNYLSTNGREVAEYRWSGGRVMCWSFAPVPGREASD
jgi:hypothetical protein